MPDISRLVIEVDSSGIVKAEGNTEAFRAALDKLTKSSKNTEKGATNLGDRMGALQLIIGKLPRGLQSIASGLMGITNPATAAVGAFLELGEAAVNFANESIKAFGEFEMIKTKLEVVTGSAKEASRTFNTLQKFSTQTPFGVDQLAQAAVMLRQAGTSANDLIPTLQALGNASSGNAEVFNRMAMNFAQIANIGKASSMDMRQFMMAGIPISKMLDDIGKSGSTSFEDIKDAILYASNEGGRFYDAMSKGADTLIGKTNNLESAWKTFKATFADTSGLATAWKWVLDDITKGINSATKSMTVNKEVRDATLRRLSGDTSSNSYIEHAQVMLKQMENMKAGDSGSIFGSLSLANDLGIIKAWTSGYDDVIKYYQKILDFYKPIIDAQNAMNEKIEEQNRLLNESKNKYTTLQGKIEEAYAKTTEGQQKALNDQIQYFRDALNQTHIKMFDYYGRETDDVNNARYKSEYGISAENRTSIEAIINMYENDLSKAINKNKNELTEWQKIFKSAMNLSETDTKQNWFTRQSSAISEFAKMLITTNDRAKILYNTIGTENNTLEQAAQAWEDIATNMIMTGEWHSNNTLFQQVAEYAKEARNAANEINLDKYISELNTELSYLKMSTAEMERQKLISEYKVNNEEKITEALRAQNVIRNEQQRLSLLTNATGLSQEEIRGEGVLNILTSIAESNNKKLEEAKFWDKLGIGDYLSTLKEVETVYASIIKIADDNRDLQLLSLKDELDAGKIDFLQYAEGFANLCSEYNELVSLSSQELGITRAAITAEEKIRNLENAMKTLGESMKNLAAGSYLNFFNDLGKAFSQGADFTDGFNNALRNMMRNLIDAMPQLLLNVGLQLIPKNLALGLAFIGASGLMSFLSGMINDTDSAKQKDEAERLRNLQQQLMDLIASQREQQEYYLTQKRRIDTTSIRVNDAIITPKGVVHTHPEDYIIATKRPQDLMSGGGANVIVQIFNNSNATVTQTESTAPDGSKLIELTIENIMRKKFADGSMDNAVDAMNQRRNGRRLSG